MAKKYRVNIEIEKLSGECAAGHAEGDSWTLERIEQPLAICPVALVAIWQKIYALFLGADFPWAEDPDVAHFSCPDRGIVTFRITREEI